MVILSLCHPFVPFSLLFWIGSDDSLVTHLDAESGLFGVFHLANLNIKLVRMSLFS
jgi:hypothetical protein